MTLSMTETSDPIARSCRRKVAFRLLPLLLAMYVVSYLDRVNAGFAALQMKDKLSFDDQILARGFGLFYIGYLLLEIPGAMIVERWSARKWFARILVTWGLLLDGHRPRGPPPASSTPPGCCSGWPRPGSSPASSSTSPTGSRGGTAPGRCPCMLLAVPFELWPSASAVSAVLLRQEWFGLAGWQWVFLVEGAPAVLLGVVIVPFAAAGPAEATPGGSPRPSGSGWKADAGRRSGGRSDRGRGP